METVPWRIPSVKGAAGLVLLASLLACGEASVYEGRGVVREVQRQERQLVLEHDEIPGLMPAMTMNFDVADPALLELAPGQVVEFRLEVTDRSYRLLEASVVAAAAVSAGPRLSDALDANDRAFDFRLVDQAGRPVGLEDFAGKTVLLDFIYTQCPGPCPILTGRQVDVQRRLPPELRPRVWFASISVDPENDTPERLRRYAEARGADLSGWSFLTGSPAQIEEVLAGYGVARLANPDGTIGHLVVTFLIDGRGLIVERFTGLDHTPEELIREIERVSG